MGALIERSVKLLLAETSAVSGLAYLEALCRSTASVLETRHAFIGRLSEDGKSVATLAYWVAGDFGEPFAYALTNTPCQGVVGPPAACLYPEHVQSLFPHDQMLIDMGIHAYFGIPIMARGNCIGVLVALHDAPVHRVDSLEPVLQLFADRAGVEIERMDAEHALRKSERRYRQFVTRCAQGVWSIDAASKTDFVNDQMAAMLGLAPQDMLGRSMFEFMDSEAQEEATTNLKRRRSGIAERHTFRLQHVDGHDVWTEMATSPVHGDNGEYAGALALVSDITDERRLQESSQQRQKLESLGVLAGGIAHDFNNLLVGILGNADLALRLPNLPAALQQLLADIQAASLRASDLTAQLLAYSGGHRTNTTVVDLAKLVQEVLGMVGATLSPNARIKLALESGMPPAQGDAAQLTQVLMNLLSNASDAVAEAGGNITIRMGVAHAGDPLLERCFLDDTVRDPPHVWVSVSDDGPGMDPKIIKQVFDPFFTTKEAGHGLGLAAVLGILRGHKGDIVIDSAVGDGCTMTILLPVAESSNAAPETRGEHHPSPPLSGLRVLVVDDEAAVRNVTTAFLESEGLVVQSAHGGHEALTCLDEAPSPFDLVILDMTMPRMSGAQTLAAMRGAGHTMPVVMTSGYSQELAQLNSSTTFLGKPYRGDDLLEAIEHALR